MSKPSYLTDRSLSVNVISTNMENHREWLFMRLVSLHIRFATTLMGPDVGVWESCNANIQTRRCWLWLQYVHLVCVCSHFPKKSARSICRTQQSPTHVMVFIIFNLDSACTMRQTARSISLCVKVAKWHDVTSAASAALTNSEVASSKAVRTNFNIQIWVECEKTYQIRPARKIH